MGILTKGFDDRMNLVLGAIQLALSFSAASLAKATFLVLYMAVGRKVKREMSSCAV